MTVFSLKLPGIIFLFTLMIMINTAFSRPSTCSHRCSSSPHKYFTQKDREIFYRLYEEIEGRIDKAINTVEMEREVEDLTRYLEHELQSITSRIQLKLGSNERKTFLNAIRSWETYAHHEYILLERQGSINKGSTSGLETGLKKARLIKDRIMFLYDMY